VLEPWSTPWLDGVALIEKSSSGRGVIVRLTVVVCVVGGDEYTPVIVSVKVPVVAVFVVVTVRVELCPACTDAGLNVPEAPAASPLIDSAIGFALPVACVFTV